MKKNFTQYVVKCVLYFSRLTKFLINVIKNKNLICCWSAFLDFAKHINYIANCNKLNIAKYNFHLNIEARSSFDIKLLRPIFQKYINNNFCYGAPETVLF